MRKDSRPLFPGGFFRADVGSNLRNDQLLPLSTIASPHLPPQPDCRYLLVNHTAERTGSLDRGGIPGSSGHDFSPRRLADATPPPSADRNVRHDVKNQLGIILGFSELMLADMADDDPQRPDVTEIRGATLMALQLLRRL
jgi:hypothetical protein